MINDSSKIISFDNTEYAFAHMNDGELKKATTGVDEEFTILMSHDPSHWDAETINHNNHIARTHHVLINNIICLANRNIIRIKLNQVGVNFDLSCAVQADSKYAKKNHNYCISKTLYERWNFIK